MDFLQNKLQSNDFILLHLQNEKKWWRSIIPNYYGNNKMSIFENPYDCYNFIYNYFNQKYDCEMSMIEKIIWLNL
jgi:hypothetical protein